jgi:hypothetical protein
MMAVCRRADRLFIFNERCIDDLLMFMGEDL